WASFLVPDALMQDLPDQAAQPVGNHADRLGVPEARDIAAIEDLEDRPFRFPRGVGRLVEQAPHLTVALRGPVTVVHLRALVLPGAGAHPGPRAGRGREGGGGGGRPRQGSAAPNPPRARAPPPAAGPGPDTGIAAR